MDKSEIKQLENMLEVVMRAIPKERQAHDFFMHAAGESRLEMARVLFAALADQEEQHESRLRAALELLKQELDEAKGKVVPDIGMDHTEDTEIPAEEKIREIEKAMEVVIRMIPKEHELRHLYLSTAKQAKREFARTLFEWLADQEKQHESKLRGILDLLKMQVHEIKHKKT